VWFRDRFNQDVLHVALSPDRLDIAMYKRGSSPELRSTAVPPSTSPDVPNWQSAVVALEAFLRNFNSKSTATKSRRRTRLHVVLSGHFTRWQLLPWSADIKNTTQLNAYAEFQFREVYGAVSQQWRVIAKTQPPGLATPVCAIDLALQEELQRIALAAGCNLVAVQPYYSAAFDTWRKKIKTKSDSNLVWFIAAEPGRVGVGLVQNGCWQALHSERVSEANTGAGLGTSSWHDKVEALMNRMALANGVDQKSGTLYVSGADNQAWQPLAKSRSVECLMPALPWGWPEQYGSKLSTLSTLSAVKA